MGRFRQCGRWVGRRAAAVIELLGVAVTMLGVGLISLPAALILSGAALVFIAQGMERDE